MTKRLSRFEVETTVSALQEMIRDAKIEIGEKLYIYKVVSMFIERSYHKDYISAQSAVNS